MQRYTRLKEDAAEDEVAFVLVVDAEIYRLDAVIRWLDAASTRVARRSSPDPAVWVPSEATPSRSAVPAAEVDR